MRKASFPNQLSFPSFVLKCVWLQRCDRWCVMMWLIDVLECVDCFTWCFVSWLICVLMNYWLIRLINCLFILFNWFINLFCCFVYKNKNKQLICWFNRLFVVLLLYNCARSVFDAVCCWSVCEVMSGGTISGLYILWCEKKFWPGTFCLQKFFKN